MYVAAVVETLGPVVEGVANISTPAKASAPAAEQAEALTQSKPGLNFSCPAPGEEEHAEGSEV